MLYKIFATEALAQAYADEQTAQLPRGPDDATQIWDTPHLTVAGEWAVCSHDDQGSEAELVNPLGAQA